ncbi:MAG: DNA gyrase C-terminal beta-propeller domain-containing protein, partial [Egibacteraceae bacterium]
DDELVAVAACRDGDHLLLAHDGGLVTRFAATEARPMGRGATGVAGLQVPDDRRVVAISVVPGGDDGLEVLTVAADGGARRTPLAEYPLKGRGGKGLQTGTDRLAWCGVAGSVHVPTGEDAVVLDTAAAAVGRRAGRLIPATAVVTGPVVPLG